MAEASAPKASEPAADQNRPQSKHSRTSMRDRTAAAGQLRRNRTGTIRAARTIAHSIAIVNSCSVGKIDGDWLTRKRGVWALRQTDKDTPSYEQVNLAATEGMNRICQVGCLTDTAGRGG